MKRRTAFLFGAAGSFASAAAALLILEVGLRLSGAGPEANPFRRVDILTDGEFRPVAFWGTAALKRPSPYPGVLAGEYLPSFAFRFVYPDNPRGYFGPSNEVESRINRYGLRGMDFDPRKPPGTFRIVALGDSYTFGEGVREEDTFLARIGEALNGAGGSPPVEVVNCGVSGYNTVDEVTYLTRQWVALAPDLVLVTFVLNDAYDESVFAPLAQGYAEGLTRLSESREMAGSRLAAFAYDRYLRWRTARRVERVYRSQFTASPLVPGHNWDSCRQALATAAQVSRSRGFRLALAIFPELYRLDASYPFSTIHALVKQEAERLGIPALDLFPVFQGREARDLWVHSTDHHPNEIAHRIAAEALLQFLRDPALGLPVPARPGPPLSPDRSGGGVPLPRRPGLP